MADFSQGDDVALRSLVLSRLCEGMVVVEVGSWLGDGSTAVIAEAIKDVPAARLFCVDTWKGSANVHAHMTYGGKPFDEFMAHTKKYESIIRPMAMLSVEAAALMQDGQADVVFIDACHAYSEVKKDLAAWWPKVKPGGILCGHDYDRPYNELDERLRQFSHDQGEEDFQESLHLGLIRAIHEWGVPVKSWLPDSSMWSVEKPDADLVCDNA